MTNDKDRVVAAAKKAARRMARTSNSSYQTCLDAVARERGCAHWGAFLTDPVPYEPTENGIHPPATGDATKDDGTSVGIPTSVPRPELGTEGADDLLKTGPRMGGDAARRRPAGFIGTIMRRFSRGPQDDLVKEAVRNRFITTEIEEGAFTLGSVVGGPEVHMRHSIPIMVSAPPGSGKTSGVVMPIILSADDSSLVVHDEKDMWRMTSGHRAALGPVHVLNLGGASSGSLNPLHADWTPEDRDELRAYVSSLCDVIHPEDAEAAKHLADVVLEIVASSRLPCFRDVNDGLTRLLDTPMADLARRSISRIAAFITDHASGCTTMGGVRPGDLRGGDADDPDRGYGMRSPTTIYIVRDIMDGRASGLVASVLQTAIWHHMLRTGPGEVRADGSRAGHLRVQVLMDGCARLEPMPKLSDALEQGRSKEVGHVLVASTSRGISHLFDDRHRDDYMSLFGMEIILIQNDSRAVAEIVDRYEGLEPKDVFSMPPGRHLIGIHGMRRPLWIKTPTFYLDRMLLQRTFNPRTRQGPKPVRTG